MLQALLVTFREGLESLLIVGVISAYLRKTGRASLLRGVRAGLAISVATCLLGAYLWQMVPNQPLYEGMAALTAAVLVGLLLMQMLRMGRRLKGDIEARVDRISAPRGPTSSDGGAAGGGTPSIGAVAGVAFVTMLLVTREGLEAVLYLGIQVRMSGTRGGSIAGGVIGLVAAAVVAWLWSRRAARLNLGVVLKVTAIFLGLFLFQLLVYGVHELAESGVIEGSQAFHDATEVAGPDGAVGHVISYSLLAAPLLYVLLSRRAGRLARPPEPRPQQTGT
jgi:high-affinity iron transporter